MNSSNDYKSSYGVWHVTTEADCEGRYTKDLGIYEGCITSIAFYLKDKCQYELMFTPVHIQNVNTADVDFSGSVDVALDIGSGTWDMGNFERVKFFKKLFESEFLKNAVVNASDYYASVKLVGAGNSDEFKRRKALEKFTDEEIELLGLSKD